MKMGKEDEEKQGMVAEFGKRAAKEEEGRTVMVGVRMDSQSRELLTWALVKVAAPGDRVIALHVLPSSSIGSDFVFKISSFGLKIKKVSSFFLLF